MTETLSTSSFQEYANVRWQQVAPVAEGFVYVVEFQGLYKIGKAKDINKRIKSFTNVILPFDFHLVFSFPCRHPLITEKRLHRNFAEFRVRGEWFALTPELLEEVKMSLLMSADAWSREEVRLYDAEIEAWERSNEYEMDLSFLEVKKDVVGANPWR